MKKDVKYFKVADLHKVVCTTQRTASVSMIEALGPAYLDRPTLQITMGHAHELKQDGWPLLLWIREPFERLASAYSIFGRNITFQEFVDRVLTETNFSRG